MRKPNTQNCEIWNWGGNIQHWKQSYVSKRKIVKLSKKSQLGGRRRHGSRTWQKEPDVKAGNWLHWHRLTSWSSDCSSKPIFSWFHNGRDAVQFFLQKVGFVTTYGEGVASQYLLFSPKLHFYFSVCWNSPKCATNVFALIKIQRGAIKPMIV